MIEIPRWILGNSNPCNMSIQTFCDASQYPYACVINLRAVLMDGTVSLFMLSAKFRVAPVKKSDSKMTIPRLELLAATIGARLYAHAKENMESQTECFFLERFVDSGILDSTRRGMGSVCVESSVRNSKVNTC